MTSIRRLLLCSILSLMAGVLSLAAIINYYNVREDINLVFDAQLIEMSYNMQRFLERYDLKELTLKAAEIDGFNGFVPNESKKRSALHQYDSKRVYQVWNTEGHLLVRHQDAPAFPLSMMKPGLAKNPMGNQIWYSYTLVDEKTGLIYIGAHRADVRYALAQKIALENTLPYLLIFPILAACICIGISIAFKPVRKITTEVYERAYDNLEPLSEKNIPLEIAQLIKAVNALFVRLSNAYEREKRFTADAAHELRTPLSASKTMLQLAQNAKSHQESQTFLKDAEKGMNRCAHVVKQLLTLNKIKPEEVLHERVDINLYKIAQDMITEISNLSDQKKSMIHNDIQKDITLYANLTSIQILLRNLLDNALRYSPPQSIVHITSNQQKDYLYLSVIDNGPGIPSELHERVFERFYRQLGTQSDGSGLGLSIVAQICELHRATITLQPGYYQKGLNVCIQFPLFDEAFETPPSPYPT